MLTYTQAKRCIKDLSRAGLEDLIKQYSEEIIESAFDCDIQPSDIEECYSGEFSSDEDFTQDLLESCGDIPKNLPFYVYIDWESTARDIMMDYSESNGHYFRNI